jgi:CRP-like cAMP-binding protein
MKGTLLLQTNIHIALAELLSDVIFAFMSASLSVLKKVVNGIHSLPEEDWNKFAALWKPFSAKRKEILTHMGEPEKYLYFVVEGVQRVYYYDEQNREATLVFMYPPSFGGVLDAMMLKVPSPYFYETLTPSHFLRASYSEVEELMLTCSPLQVLIIKGLSSTFAGVLERMAELQCYSAEERFRKLATRSPHILQLVPHKYLANYLGIDATNFSKLINKIKI